MRMSLEKFHPFKRNLLVTIGYEFVAINALREIGFTKKTDNIRNQC